MSTGAGRDNAADVECSSETENKVEGEDSWRTVNCLRGRLLAERMASRNAREEADHLEIRLMEVEMLLEREGKSRKRAEKKLKLLRKRVECINVSYVADESQQSASSSDKTTDHQFSSASSSSAAPAASIENSKPPPPPPSSSEVQDSYLSCADELNLYDEDSRMESSCGDDSISMSMALVPVEMSSPEKERAVDPEILDATVRQVLESLRRAKEQIQSSMERRRRVSMSTSVIQVG